jgi:pimeloyl-ACP methyl ester carboxylesterase
MIENHLDTGGGVRMRYLEGGAGDPIVVLHGGEGLAWSSIHESLAGRYRVIAPEVPFVGTGARLSMRELGRTLTSFASGLGLDRYRLMSSGLSARIALWQAIDTPERIDALVMIAPAAILPDDWPAPAGMPAALAELARPHRDPELERRLGEIRAPVLVIFGTRDDVVPPAMGRHYRERIPNSYYVMVYDAGHAIAAERPDALTKLVGDFLERGDAFIVNRASGLINP